ncbi:MAG: hypothetical protein ACYDHZ_00365 [Dehalococcoidia bacterium]
MTRKRPRLHDHCSHGAMSEKAFLDGLGTFSGNCSKARRLCLLKLYLEVQGNRDAPFQAECNRYCQMLIQRIIAGVE